jgi:peptidoglycan/LPS O-acetylase OafA/YrhL
MARAPSGVQRSLALDGLRGLAALTVLVWHVVDRLSHGTLQGDGVLTHALGDSGKVAVSLFFVLSGFLLARPLLAWLLGQRERPSLPRFLRARLLRIVPAWLLIVAVVVPIVQPSVLEQPENLFSFATLTYFSFDPEPVRYIVPQSWTLTIELAVYLLLPLLALAAAPLVLRARQAWRAPLLAAGLLSIVAFSVAWRFFMYDPTGRPLHDVRPLNHLVPVFADHFAFGALAALIVLAGRAPQARWTALAAAAVLVPGWLSAVDPAMRIESRTMVAAGLALLVLAAATARGGLASRALGSTPSAYLGQRSYGVYLWHYALFEAAWALGVFGPHTPVPVAIAMLLAASLLAAEISWRMVERPALALVDRKPAEARPRPTARPSMVLGNR